MLLSGELLAERGWSLSNNTFQSYYASRKETQRFELGNIYLFMTGQNTKGTQPPTVQTSPDLQWLSPGPCFRANPRRCDKHSSWFWWLSPATETAPVPHGMSLLLALGRRGHLLPLQQTYQLWWSIWVASGPDEPESLCCCGNNIAFT